MRWLAILCILSAVLGSAEGASVRYKIRLAQTSTTTNCMMSCNAQAAACQSACFVPSPAAVGSTTATAPTSGPNPTASTSCVMGCTNTQLACQQICARASPSP